MANLNLSVAIGDYDRNRPLIDGAVKIDGVDPVFMTLSPEEIFFRAFRSTDFDICELSLSSFTVKTALGECPYVGIPAFVSRAFRHTSIYVRTDRIKEPKDLKGKKVGVLFGDPTVPAKDYFRRTGIFPIMHLIGIRRTLVEKFPYLPVAVFKAFEQSKSQALAALSDTAATKVTLPFVEEKLKETRDLM